MSSQKNEKKKHTRKERKVQTYNNKSTQYTHPPIFPPNDAPFILQCLQKRQFLVVLFTFFRFIFTYF